MPAIGQDITHYVGDSATITIPVKDGAGAAVDLAGATANWWMGKSVSATGGDVYVKKSVGSGLVITRLGDKDANNADIWSLVITLDPADTEGRTAGKFYHEAEVIDADGDPSTVTIGKFILNPTLITGV